MGLEELIALLRCPVSGETLELLPAEEAEAIRVRTGDSADAYLAVPDGAWLYPVRNGIPVLLPDAALRP